jgi:hypothetical protein
MSKILTSLAVFALLTMLALPTANAAERRADGVRPTDATAPTELSSRRRYHRRYVVVRRAWRPRYSYYPYYRPYYRPYYAGYPYASYGYPYYRPGPVVSFGFGFGPRWGW